MEKESKREISAILRTGTCKNYYIGNFHFQSLVVPENKGVRV